MDQMFLLLALQFREDENIYHCALRTSDSGVLVYASIPPIIELNQEDVSMQPNEVDVSFGLTVVSADRPQGCRKGPIAEGWCV